MSQVDVIRAWKDENYWAGLSELEKMQVPENPAGLIELDRLMLGAIAGGCDTTDQTGQCTFPTCPPDPNFTCQITCQYYTCSYPAC